MFVRSGCRFEQELQCSRPEVKVAVIRKTRIQIEGGSERPDDKFSKVASAAEEHVRIQATEPLAEVFFCLVTRVSLLLDFLLTSSRSAPGGSSYEDETTISRSPEETKDQDPSLENTRKRFNCKPFIHLQTDQSMSPTNQNLLLLGQLRLSITSEASQLVIRSKWTDHKSDADTGLPVCDAFFLFGVTRSTRGPRPHGQDVAVMRFTSSSEDDVVLV